MRTLPFEPLAQLTGHLTTTELARRVGVRHDDVIRWIRSGRIAPSMADQAACRLGLHPRLIWSEFKNVRFR